MPPAQHAPAPGPQKPPFPQKYALDTVDLNDVEIWSTGTFNGDTYTESDLADMEKNHAALDGIVKPYMKLGHDKGQKLIQDDGYPSAGWVTNVKKKGLKLYGDIKSVPKKLAEMIEAKAYGRFSPEIFWNLKHEGKTYRRVLGALALLGADTPANPTLEDFINLYTHFDAELKTYHTLQRGSNMDELERLKAENAQLKADKDAQSKQYSATSDALAKLESEKFASDVDQAWKKYSGKLPPAVEHLFRAICHSDRTEAKVYSYKEKEKEKEAERKIEYSSALDLVGKFAEAMPSLGLGARLSKGSDARDIQSNADNSDPYDTLDAKAKQYVKRHAENGVTKTYTEALLAVKQEDDNV